MLLTKAWEQVRHQIWGNVLAVNRHVQPDRVVWEFVRNRVRNLIHTQVSEELREKEVR